MACRSQNFLVVRPADYVRLTQSDVGDPRPGPGPLCQCAVTAGGMAWPGTQHGPLHGTGTHSATFVNKV